jgi:Tfp pilus assembly protein PilO
MNIDRKLLTELCFLLFVCGGGWTMLVNPQVKELRELRATIDEAQANPVLASRTTIEEMAGRLSNICARVDEVDHESRLARDSSRMYGHIMSLAERHSVTMLRLDPGQLGAGGTTEQPYEITRFSMAVEGRYREIAAFVHAVQGIDGFVRGVSLNLTPKGESGGGMVDAQFSCEALSFGLPAVLANLEGRKNAHD